MDEQRDHARERQYGADWNRSSSNRSDWNRSDSDRSDWNRADEYRRDYRADWNRPDYRSDWGRPEPRRESSPEETGRYQDWGRNWSGADWDRERSYRPQSERQYDTSNRRTGGAMWSTDDGRMEFGGSSVQSRGYGGSSVQDNRWGRGPKGYQRADNRIHEDVCDRLTYSDVDAENIEVTVTNGEVTLSGTVRDRWDKRRAEDVAEHVSGVRDVHNNIRVHREARGIGQSETSASDQPGTVLGVNPTSSSNITNTPPSGNKRS
jgi:hypothetical protein